MLALSTTFVIARFIIRGIKHRYFLGEEIPIAIAWACMTGICSTFIATAPTVFKATAVFAGQQPPNAEVIKDAELIYKIFFANVLLFYSCLWGVKIALLVQYKRLIDQQRTYTVIWWCIVGFVVASYIAAVAAYLTPCKGLLHKYFTFRTTSVAPVLPDITLLTCLKPRAARRPITDVVPLSHTLLMLWMLPQIL